MTGWTSYWAHVGTSVDGIDAAILKTDGTGFVRTGVAGFIPISQQPAMLSGGLSPTLLRIWKMPNHGKTLTG